MDIIISFLIQKVPLLVLPLLLLLLLLYIAIVFVRIREKIGNYKDWQKTNKRDEKLKLNEIAENMAGRGLVSSGQRNRVEKQAKEDFEIEHRKKKRKFWVDLINSFFLK